MAAAQLPNAYFNPMGQLPIYLGITEVSILLPDNLAAHTGALLALDLATAPADLQEGESAISTWSDAAVNWIYGQLCQKVGDINTWITSASGNDASGIYDNISLFNKDNRTIVTGFTLKGIAKVAKTTNSLILNFVFSKQFQAYANFFAQSGGTMGGAVATLEGDKVGYFTNQGIRFIRMAKTFSQLSPDEQKAFTAKLEDYRSQRGSDLVMDLIIVNTFDIAKAEITHESLKDWLVDEIIDNGDLIFWAILLMITDGGTAGLKPAIKFGIRFGINLGVSFGLSPYLVKVEKNMGLHQKLANTPLVNNAANFMSQTYTEATTSAIVQNVIKHLTYIMETAGESSNE